MRILLFASLLVLSAVCHADATDKLEIGMTMDQVNEAIGGHQGSEVKDGTYRHFHNVTKPPLILTYSDKKKLIGWEIDKEQLKQDADAQAAADAYVNERRERTSDRAQSERNAKIRTFYGH